VGRRKRQSVSEDLLDGVARLPWWGGVLLAFLPFVFFHWLSGRAQPTITNPNQVAGNLFWMALPTLGRVLQYIVPFICVVGAAVSFLTRRRREALVQSSTASDSADVLKDLTWREFEELTAEAFRLAGFSVKELGGAGPDGGVDLELRKGGETLLVQCKQWRAFKVGVDVVRELYGVMAAQGAAGGYVITSGTFTQDARAFAEGRNIRLVDGRGLHGMLQKAKSSSGAKTVAPVHSLGLGPAAPPECPICHAGMVRRTAKKGANAGAQFWGCSTFPACRGTR
jgi:restriction system protein